MQSNVNCVREAEHLGQDRAVSLYDDMKGARMIVGKCDDFVVVLHLGYNFYFSYSILIIQDLLQQFSD